MSRIKKAIVIAITLSATLAAAVSSYPWIEPARVFYSVHGIDVSHHQGKISWPDVASDGVAFVYIKATEGGDFVDPRFVENWRGSGAAGISRGAYHFFTQCRSGERQASNFIRTVPVDDSALPHVIDAEHMGPCRRRPQIKDVVAEITIFLDKLEQHYGRRPLIYTTREFHDAYLENRLLKERFWIRSLVLPPRFRRKQWMVWQYHNRGRRRGIAGPVDLNVLRSSTLERLRSDR